MSPKKRDDGRSEGIHSLLDTDLYKLTMQAALLQHFPNIGSNPQNSGSYVTEASYIYINRKKSMKLTHEAYLWLQSRINGIHSFQVVVPLIKALENLRVTDEELAWLKKNCSYLPDAYLNFLKSFRFYPQKQVTLEWHDDKKDISILMHGRWIDTILYEIPILALVSEAYFRFVDTEWDYVGQYGT